MVDDAGICTYLWTKFFQSLPFNLKTQQLIRGTHATRGLVLPTQYADGSEFYETDRNLWYTAVGNAWRYKAGILSVPQVALSQFTDLGPNDTGLLVNVTDYAHCMMWAGTGWQFAPGDPGSDFIVAFVSGPDPATGWHSCDGSSGVPKLNSDGTVTTVTVPNTAGSWYRQ